VVVRDQLDGYRVPPQGDGNFLDRHPNHGDELPVDENVKVSFPGAIHGRSGAREASTHDLHLDRHQGPEDLPLTRPHELQLRAA
jgi:hypothetical protein